MTLSTERKISLGFGGALIVLVLISCASYRSIRELTAAANSRQQAHETLKGLKSLLSELQDAETGQRGFLITGEPLYLEPYSNGIKGLDGKMREVRRLSADNTNDDQYLKALQPLIASKLAELQKTIELRSTGGFEAARQTVMTDQGKNSMDEIRRLIALVEAVWEKSAAERDQVVEARARWVEAVIGVGSLFAVAMVLTASSIIRRELAARQRAREELKQFAASLGRKNAELREALANVKTLSGLIPICAACKKIRDDKGYWNQIEIFIRDRSDAKFSHGMCPDCSVKMYPQLYPERAEAKCGAA